MSENKKVLKVQIQSDGITAKELNPLGEEEPKRPNAEDYFAGIVRPEQPEYDIASESYYWAKEDYRNAKEQWQQAESERKVYEIDRETPELSADKLIKLHTFISKKIPEFNSRERQIYINGFNDGRYTEKMQRECLLGTIHEAELLPNGKLKLI